MFLCSGRAGRICVPDCCLKLGNNVTVHHLLTVKTIRRFNCGKMPSGVNAGSEMGGDSKCRKARFFALKFDDWHVACDSLGGKNNHS